MLRPSLTPRLRWWRHPGRLRRPSAPRPPRQRWRRRSSASSRSSWASRRSVHDDDFFELGGDSLAAVDAVSVLHETYQVDLGVDEFADLRTPRR
ncbi:acyl carrier protein [Streptomyces thioluteus]|uniref:acyl carrier protein n=1 Tax=Streptomyces thioluteus TaxID=66431 RepID=UPI003CD09AC0